jgi:hypothetical protein
MTFKATIGDYDNVIGSRSFDNLDAAEMQAERWLHNLGKEHALVESVICLITVQRHDSVNDSWQIVSEFEH